ncbi:MAG: Omp28-related outer membrane protein, partial [Chitinophagaceae bacterium]
KWNNTSASLQQLTQERAALGLAFETIISGSTISVKTKVKFDVSTSIPLKLIVMLVEDGLLYNQANYGHFGLPNPIVNFRHKNTLRAAATDIFGDAIPGAQQIKGNTWEKQLSFNAATYNTANCYIIATVIYDINNQNRKGALNTQIVAAGQNKDFD